VTESGKDDVARDEPDLGTLAVIYEEVRRSLDQQIQLAESLNGRAQQILGFSIVIVSVIAAVDTRDESGWVRALGFASLVLFVVAAVFGFRAWWFQSYRDDPDVANLYESYLNDEESTTRNQVIGNRLAAIEANLKIIDRRKRLIEWSFAALVVGVALLLAFVTVRAFGDDPNRQPTRVPWHHGKEEGDR
jgi:hypothetical protein